MAKLNKAQRTAISRQLIAAMKFYFSNRLNSAQLKHAAQYNKILQAAQQNAWVEFKQTSPEYAGKLVVAYPTHYKTKLEKLQFETHRIHVEAEGVSYIDREIICDKADKPKLDTLLKQYDYYMETLLFTDDALKLLAEVKQICESLKVGHTPAKFASPVAPVVLAGFRETKRRKKPH